MRILIVEDEHMIANALKKGLEQERFAVDVAYTGDDGLDLALSEEYDLMILDRMLPGMDGIAICQAVRQAKIHTPILILSAKGQTEDKIQGLDTGADDYLAKPFSFEELLARVRALSRRPTVTTGTTLVVADLTLDTISYVVTRGGKPLKISHKEFALLKYLMLHTGKVHTKDQIIAHVWDYDADILPNTVEVYIRNLRNKIDYPFPKSPQLIHTVRGFGYTLEDGNWA